MNSSIEPFIQPGAIFEKSQPILTFPIPDYTEAIRANAHYFGHKEWAEEYLQYCHREDTFKVRWLQVMGDVSQKVIVDIGCGPGNIFANFSKKPKVLIGIDVAAMSLELAAAHGYIPVLADATKLPFISGFADIVTLNAALHHCEDMKTVLSEAARLVKPGGLLITDHDPQLSAWDYKGLAKLMWNARLWLYKITGKGFHKTNNQQYWGLACEIHHKPGHGVTNEMFKDVLLPLGFEVNIFPHNHTMGSEIFNGKKGQPSFKYKLANILSGRNPNADKSALSLMCVAIKKNTQ